MTCTDLSSRAWCPLAVFGSKLRWPRRRMMARSIDVSPGGSRPVYSSIFVAILYSCDSSWIWWMRAGWSRRRMSSWGNFENLAHCHPRV